MSLENVVNEIFRENTNYLTAQQVINQARSLKSLSNDLYTDSIRFVYELVQNCDDACQTKSILRIGLVDHRYLIIAHNGKPFSEDDVRGLCDVGCSTKGQDDQKTGYKGLGFKAVFGRSDYVLVLSNGEYFRFEENSKVFQWNSKWGTANQQMWEEQNNHRLFEYPWQICPIWTKPNEVPENIRKWFLGQLDAVATIIRLKNPVETREAIGQLIEQPHVFMFLRNIRTIRFSINTPQEVILNVTTLRDGSLQIVYDWRPMSHWLLHKCTIDVPDRVRDDIRLPEKLREAKSTELMLAARIDKNDNIESVQGRQNGLFAYLPTKIISYNFPFLVNANFLTNASREHIHTDSSWNQHIFSRIPHEMIKWIGQLRRQDKWAEKALDLLPNPIQVNDSLAQQYNENCPRAAGEGSFLLNTRKELLRINEAVIDMTGFSKIDCIGNDRIRSFIIRTYSPRPSIALRPFVSNSSRVRKFRIPLFDWTQCINMLHSEEFLRTFTVEDNIQFLTHLFTECQKQPQMQNHFITLPCILDRQGILRTMNSIYLLSQFNNADWSINNDSDVYVHDDIMAWLRKNIPILNWLQSLGVKEKTDEIFVRQKIIPNVRHYINSNNALPTIRKLFQGFQHGQIRMEIFQQLNKLKLFSISGNLVPADELYFSDRYQPRLSLDQSGFDPSNFLSPNYLDDLQANIDMIKRFFLLFGVQEDIRLIRFTEDQRNEVLSSYHYQQTQNLFRYNSLQYRNRLTLPFLDLTQGDYEFALFFWQHVIFSINVNELNEPEVLICDQQQMHRIDNLPFWFVRTRNCIPTTTRQLLKSTDVFSSDLRPIVADLLPVFACTTQIPFPPPWQHFFQFKTFLSLQDHMQLLNLLYDRLKSHPINDENEANIQRIYTSLLSCLSGSHKQEIDRFRPRQPFYLLSTINNTFVSSDELIVLSTKDFTLPNDIPQLKLSTGNQSHHRLSLLLDFFNIKQITVNDLVLPPVINAQPSLSLRARVRCLQSHLYREVHDRNIRRHHIDNDLELFELDRLELYYKGTIPVLQKHIHHDGNRIYVTLPWNSKEVMASLPQILCTKFELPSDMALEIREFLLDDENDISLVSSPLNLEIDLLHMGGTRSKFAMVIDRDNEQLFRHLELTDTTDPGEFLIKALESQESRFSGYVYHYTHLENAVSILRDRALKCRTNLPRDSFKDSSPRQILQQTRPEIKDYARFYFRTLTPIQYCNENLGRSDNTKRYGNRSICPVPIIFRIDLKSILAIPNIQWKISLGNLTSPQTQFDNTIQIIKEFDYQHVYADIHTERGKYSSQHEFLVKSQLNFNDLNDEDITIIFQDENAQNTFEQIIDHPYSILVNESFFFNSNIRIQIEYERDDDTMRVFTNSETSLANQDQLILQLTGNNNIERIIEGNLSRSIHRGNVSTVYSNQQFSFMVDEENLQHGIYYEYDDQQWLIHTNSSQPRFIQP